MNRGPSSSPMLLSVVVMLLGAVMLKLSGVSPVAMVLGVAVLGMGLAATAVLLLRYSRAAAAPDGRADAGAAAGDRAAAGAQCRRARSGTGGQANVQSAATVASSGEGLDPSRALTQLLDAFGAWWRARDDQEPWPAFDRWVRDTLQQLAGARRPRCFHVHPGDRRLFSLADDLDDAVTPGGAWRPLVEHVVDSGRMFVRGAAASGELMRQLSGDSAEAGAAGTIEEPPRWLLPIRDGGQTRGLIVAADFASPDWQSEEVLGLAGRVLELCWLRVQQGVELESALRTDRASGVLNRADLTDQAERVLAEAAQEGEPVVLMALAIEGLRRLDDGHQWDLQNWLMQQVGRTLRRRLRSDDVIGRFSDDRFVVVMRRLDLALGELIARKVLAAVREVVAQGDPVLASSVGVRCGLAADHRADFDRLLGRACDALQQARADQADLAASGAAARSAALAAGAAG